MNHLHQITGFLLIRIQINTVDKHPDKTLLFRALLFSQSAC